jgi:foldase protein PrsA
MTESNETNAVDMRRMPANAGPVNAATASAEQPSGGKKRKATLIVAGTALAVLVAAVAFQFLRPKEGTAGENGPEEQSNSAGDRYAPSRKALARVNGELIAYDVVAEECMQRYGQEVLDSFINRLIILQACRKQGLEISDADVTAEIIKIAKKFDITPEQWFHVLETERHVNPRQYRQDVIWPMLALKKLAGADVKITEEEMQRVFIRDFGERVKARAIICDKLSRAQEAWNLVMKDPSNFGKVAREKSIDPTSKAIDGQIQPIRQTGSNDNVEREAFRLHDGEISGIIDASTPEARRYVILMCEGRTTPIVKSIDDAGIREQVQKQIEDEKTQMAVAKVFERVKKEAEVDNFLTNTSTRAIRPVTGNSSDGRVVPANGYRTRGQGATRNTAPSYEQ